jgi:hypothetical protein
MTEEDARFAILDETLRLTGEAVARWEHDATARKEEAMNHFKAREIAKDGKPTGRFRFTKENAGIIFPVGPCALDCPGHDTAEEACEHYRQGILDSEWTKGHDEDEQRTCAICKEWTHESLYHPGTMNYFDLCQKHQNKESLDKLLGPVVEFYAS